ncbi:hypothetical protein AGMMS50296_3400 [Alphaproteobacteria bacterium]|nr:hypothetical protein AGMMS50296_3400 [Alphaproteobacteria bacterium]
MKGKQAVPFDFPLPLKFCPMDLNPFNEVHVGRVIERVLKNLNTKWGTRTWEHICPDREHVRKKVDGPVPVLEFLNNLGHVVFAMKFHEGKNDAECLKLLLTDLFDNNDFVIIPYPPHAASTPDFSTVFRIPKNKEEGDLHQTPRGTELFKNTDTHALLLVAFHFEEGVYRFWNIFHKEWLAPIYWHYKPFRLADLLPKKEENKRHPVRLADQKAPREKTN